MEIREFEIRSVNTDKREVTGIAVPFDTPTSVGGYNESFARGAIGSAEGVKLFWNHQEPIGRVVRGEETDNGYEVTAHISETTRGNEAYTLLRDGVVDKFSVGFVPVEHRTENDVVVRTKVDLKEVSLVPFPAYKGASVTEVRAQSETAEEAETNNTNLEERNMSENDTNSEVVELREAVNDLERRFAVLGDKNNEPAKTQFRSGAEFLKALAANDESARMEMRAFTGATTSSADVTRPGWVNSALKLVAENRQVLNLFAHAGLPASGNSVEYPQVTGTSGTVGVQAAEGDDLPYMAVTLGSATAPVKTYGGYSSLSRQAIERSDLAYLDTVLRYQALQYAAATEKAVRDALTAGTGYNTGTLASDTAAAWIDIVIDSAALIEDNSKGASAEFVLVSRDVFKRIAHMVDGQGRPLFAVNGDGSNTIGSVGVRGVANIAGLPVIVGPKLAANTMFVASSEAMTVFESAGAPVRLADDNIINLTKDFSLYGYMAVAINNPLAVVKVDADLVA